MSDTKAAILTAAKEAAQAHGYGGLNFRDIAARVGIRSASLHYHFPTKPDLAVAVARRYWEDASAELEAKSAETPDPLDRLRWYPGLFRRALVNGNRMCLCSFMAAEHDDLPEAVRAEALKFAEVNLAWLARTLRAAGIADADRAGALYAAVTGAQLLARSRADVSVFDRLIESYRRAGLLPEASGDAPPDPLQPGTT